MENSIWKIFIFLVISVLAHTGTNAQTPPVSNCDPTEGCTNFSMQYVVTTIQVPGYDCPFDIQYWRYDCDGVIKIGSLNFVVSDYNLPGCQEIINKLIIRDFSGNAAQLDSRYYNTVIYDIGQQIAIQEFEAVQDDYVCPKKQLVVQIMRPVCSKLCSAFAVDPKTNVGSVYDIAELECYSTTGCCITENEMCIDNGVIKINQRQISTANCDDSVPVQECYNNHTPPPAGCIFVKMLQGECTPSCK